MSDEFLIYLLRNPSEPGLATADIIRISRAGSGLRVAHTDKNEGSNKTTSLLLPRMRLSNYLRALFQSFRADESCDFKTAQFYAPGFPPILVRVLCLNDRGSMRDAVYDMAEAVEESWFAPPVISPTLAPAPAKPAVSSNFVQKSEPAPPLAPPPTRSASVATVPMS